MKNRVARLNTPRHRILPSPWASRVHFRVTLGGPQSSPNEVVEDENIELLVAKMSGSCGRHMTDRHARTRLLDVGKVASALVGSVWVGVGVGALRQGGP